MLCANSHGKAGLLEKTIENNLHFDRFSPIIEEISNNYGDIHQIPTAIDMIEDAKAKGYEVSVNIMAVSKVNSDDLTTGLELLAQSSVDMIYLVDSFGSFYPEQITSLSQKYVGIAKENDKVVGMHAHNNQQLAFANTIEACRNGVDILDATVNEIGRAHV